MDTKRKGVGNGTKRQRQCTHCNGKNHTAEQCWRNPGSPSYKPELASTASTASTSASQESSIAGSAGAAAAKAEAERAVAQAMAKFGKAAVGIALAAKGTTDFIIDSGASFNFVGKDL